jgi:SulP family sulfate permease
VAVGDIASIKGGIPAFHIPDVAFNFATLKIIFPYALTMALVGLIESLLTLNLVDVACTIQRYQSPP